MGQPGLADQLVGGEAHRYGAAVAHCIFGILDQLAQWDATVVIPGHGSPGTVATLRQQRAYLAGMLDQVRSGLRKGKTADQLAQEIDVSGYGSFGVNAELNRSSIRAIYRKLSR